MFHGSRILVAPLDWGLGHATRCIPVIRRSLHFGAVPVIGASNAPLELLRSELPQLEFVPIEGREVKYSASGDQTVALALQLPSLLRSIEKENSRTKKLIKEFQIDAIISDQRFGVRDPRVPSVLLTHQLFPKMQFGQAFARWLNDRYIDRFDRCWIVDRPEFPGLAGELSHGSIPEHSCYIGPLSRFDRAKVRPENVHRIVAIISGPEPQRSMLEEILIAQMRRIEGRHLLVKGTLTDRSEQIGNIRVVPHLSTEGLAGEMMNAELIVSRCGYSTIMDLERLGRSALLIPTPGQPEQEYLARLHAGSNRSIIQHQHAIDLDLALTQIGKCSIPPIDDTDQLLDRALEELAAMIRQRKMVRGNDPLRINPSSV